MAKTKSVNNIENIEKTEVKETVGIKENSSQEQVLAEIMKQMQELKNMQLEFLKEKQAHENDKKEFELAKESSKQTYTPTAGNEFIEVICNIPKFEIDDLGAYDLGTRNSGKFQKLPKYGARVNIQFSELQEIIGYPSNGLLIGSIFISKKHQNAIRDLGLQYVYENIVYPEDMDDFFKKPIEEIEKVMKQCPERMKEAFIEITKIKSRNGEIDSVAKLRRIEDVLNVRL